LLAQQRLAAVLRQATADYESGDFQGAIARLDSLQGEAAGDLSVLNLRAAALTKAGNYDQAAQIFAGILRANPEYFPAAFNAGEVQFLSGKREAALETFRLLRQRDPRNELLRFKYFLCQFALGRDEDAAKTARAMQPAGSTPSWYYAQALFARRQGDESKARKNLQAARSLYGEDGCRLFDESVTAAGL
jgi:tetratricopeptide (TPR) repeat protein